MTIRIRSNESGIAMIIALFMMLALSVVGATLMTVSLTETDSSHNYRMMSQARYGAESAVHQTANYLLNTYTPPATLSVADPLAAYTSTSAGVTWNNQPVVLSSDPAGSNYPIDAVKTAFGAASHGGLDMKDAPVTFTTTAALLSMREITDAYSKKPVTLQTWLITGTANITAGLKTAQVEVESVVERQSVPIFSYAAFATYNGCAALDFAGGANTDSYDSSWALDPATNAPITSQTWGNVGTNGNLTEVGSNTVIHGSISTPRKGVGNCSNSNVTAETLKGGATVDKGLNPLPQNVTYPDPEEIDPKPPLTDQQFKKTTGCPTPTPTYCTTSAGPSSTLIATFNPPSASSEVYLGDVTINAQAEIHLNAGTYVVNSLKMEAGSKIYIDSGPVVINVEGVDASGNPLTTPVQITGQGIVNTSFKSTDLQIVYGGTGEISLEGGEKTSAVVYAPNASAKITGNKTDLYGAIIVHELKDSGGAQIHYDRHLKTLLMVPGDFTMSAFTWKSY